MKLGKSLAVAAAMVGLIGMMASGAFAYDTNITIPDTFLQSGNDWWNRTTATKAGEDQETEGIQPNTQTGQKWDNEAFFLTGSGQATTLTVVSGFNFATGYEGVTTGDIFIGNHDKIQAPVWGTSAPTVDLGTVSNSAYHWDYVIHLDLSSSGSGTATAYQLTEQSILETVLTPQFTQTSPWKWQSGGTELWSQVLIQGTITDAQVTPGVNVGDPTYEGDAEAGVASHYVLDLALGWLPSGNYDFHYTYGCGNDLLMGYGSVTNDNPTNPVPVPASILLLGSGLVGLGFAFCRRRRAG